jgi:hypothetical protein
LNAKSKINLERAQQLIQNTVEDLVDVPNSILEDSKTNTYIFYRVQDIVKIINKLVLIEILSYDDIEKIRLDYDIVISKILNATDDRFILTSIISYIQGKISTALEYSIAYTLYETSENIKRFENYYDFYIDSTL